MKAAIVYSGGMDSTVLLYMYQKNIDLAISYNYGSKHNDIEFKYAKKNTERLGIEHIRVDLTGVMKDFRSDLLKSGGDIPEGHYAADNMKSTVVPFRNGIMLSIAAGLAESRDLDTILIANHYGDFAQYPDCRDVFIEGMQQAIYRGTGEKVELHAPFTHIDKRRIAEMGRKIGVPFEDTWSCYKGGEIHCGTCGTCVERVWALKGFDPTVYEDKDFAIKELKKTGEWYEED